jgi:hypothetical protein
LDHLNLIEHNLEQCVYHSRLVNGEQQTLEARTAQFCQYIIEVPAEETVSYTQMYEMCSKILGIAKVEFPPGGVIQTAVRFVCDGGLESMIKNFRTKKGSRRITTASAGNSGAGASVSSVSGQVDAAEDAQGEALEAGRTARNGRQATAARARLTPGIHNGEPFKPTAQDASGQRAQSRRNRENAVEGSDTVQTPRVLAEIDASASSVVQGKRNRFTTDVYRGSGDTVFRHLKSGGDIPGLADIIRDGGSSATAVVPLPGASRDTRLGEGASQGEDSSQRRLIIYAPDFVSCVVVHGDGIFTVRYTKQSFWDGRTLRRRILSFRGVCLCGCDTKTMH